MDGLERGYGVYLDYVYLFSGDPSPSRNVHDLRLFGITLADDYSYHITSSETCPDV